MGGTETMNVRAGGMTSNLLARACDEIVDACEKPMPP